MDELERRLQAMGEEIERRVSPVPVPPFPSPGGRRTTNPWWAVAVGVGLVAVFVPLALRPAPEPAATTLGPPAAAGSSTTGTLGGIDGCPNFTETVETGPDPTIGGEDDPVAMSQERLAGDAEKAHSYALQHPETFGSIRFENSPWVRLVIGFTDDLAEHCAALRGLFEFPDEFQLVRAEVTEARLLEIQQGVNVAAGEFLVSSAVGAGPPVFVGLRADAEELAAELTERYGDLVSITVGLLSYPDRQRPEGVSCSALIPPPPSQPTSLVAEMLPIEGPVSSGADFEANVRVTNRGDETVSFESGQPLIGFVFRQGETTPIAMYAGGIAGTGVGAELAPGEFIDIEVLGGTASCDPALGYRLPAGRYEVRTPVDQYEYPDGTFEQHAILSAPTTLVIEG
jgi:hypothetical protein